MPSWLSTLLLAVVVILAVVGVASSVTYILDVWPRESEEGNADWADRLERIRNIAIIVGGVAALGLAYWRGKTADRQATAAQEQVETTVRQIEIAHEQVQAAQQQVQATLQGQLNERYQKSAEMLGSEVLSVRLGGIVALEHLALEHPKQHHADVMKLLFAFIRQPIEDQKVRNDSTWGMRGGRSDVLAAIDAVKMCRLQNRKIEANSLHVIDLRGANLQQTDLSDIDLSIEPAADSRAFVISALLPGIQYGRMDLSHANLSNARLNDATLSRCFCDSTNFTAADLSGADLTGAWVVNSNLRNATLRGTNLSGAKFQEAPPGKMGLTQRQLDEACADSDKPPKLVDMFDAETGERLVWRGKECKKWSES